MLWEQFQSSLHFVRLPSRHGNTFTSYYEVNFTDALYFHATLSADKMANLPPASCLQVPDSS